MLVIWLITLLQSNINYIKNKGINKFNNYGKKSAQNTYKNIKRAREKIIKSKIKNKGIKQSIKTSKNTTKLTKKSIKTTQRAVKHTAKATKETIKATQKAIKLAKEMSVKAVQTIKATFKAIATAVKSIIATTKTLITAIVAGGWVAVILIIVIVLIAGLVATIYSIGNDENLDTSFFTGSEIVLVAKSQIGNVGGEPYWSWYGFKERVEWCACFVSFCADQTGYIESGEIPKYSLCSDGIDFFKKKEKWQDRSETYIPKQSDIIFFDWEVDGVCDHTGIVESIDFESNKVKTIEGNSNDAVKELEYDLRDERIMGYGTADYKK